MASRQPQPDIKPFVGFVETTLNALRLIQAARQGIIPRITRRLNDAERRSMIKSGSTFVFGVEESGIKRWTDGLLWSPSRIVGNFLVYREINERTNSRGHHRKPYPTEAPASGNLHEQRSIAYANPQQLSSEPRAETFKEHGLIKKTITVTVDGSDLHLISYYTAEDVRSGLLRRPSSRKDIMALDLPPHLFRLTNFRNPPKVENGPDGRPRLVCEMEELESTECSIDDAPYRLSQSPDWQSECSDQMSPVDPSFPVSISRVLRSPTESAGLYSGTGVDERWAGQYESSPAQGRRHDGHWSTSSPAYSPYNRDGSLSENSLMQTETWASWNTQRGSSRSHNLYDMSAGITTFETSADRSRSRRSIQNTDHVSEGNGRGEAVYSSYGQLLGSSDMNSQRLGWAFQTETGDRMGQSWRSTVSFTPAPSTSLSLFDQYHNVQGYNNFATQTYPALWSSSSDSDSESPEGLFPSVGELSYFPQGYANAGDYRDR